MALFDFLNPNRVKPVTVRDVTNVRGLPPAKGLAVRPPVRPGLINPVTAAYMIPGFADQKQRNAATGLQMAAGPLNELRYIGKQLLQGQIPYTDPTARARATGMSGRYLPPGEQERSWLYSQPQASGGGSPAAAERAYRQEVSRVAQLTAQDPELQRYEAARKVAAAPGASPEQVQSAEDIGMQMWAKANPKLAAKVKPGQAGYDVIQRTINAGTMGAPMDLNFPTGAAALGTSGAPETSSYTGVTPAAIGNVPPLSPFGFANAQNQKQAEMFTRFTEGPTLGTQPLGNPTASMGEVPTYAGLQNPQGIGSSISDEQAVFGSDAAKALADSYVKKLMRFQGV